MTIYKYVDTAADGAGNGTTRAHTGTNGAYASQSSARASLPTTLTADVVIRCAGVADDTTAVAYSSITPAGFTITVVGDRGEDDSAGGGDDGALYDNDGFYDGQLAYSDAHYRLIQASTTTLIISVANAITVDGLQLHSNRGSGSVVSASSTAYVIKNCRIGGASIQGITCNTSSASDRFKEISNNIIYQAGGGNSGIALGMRGTGQIGNCYNNTVFGCPTGITVADINATTINLKNNVVFNCTTEYAGLNAVTTTVNATHNAGEGAVPTGHDSNWVTLNATLTVDMVDPENATESLKNTYPVAAGALENAGIGSGTDANVPTVDILGTSRSTTAPEIGAFELVVAGGSVGTSAGTSVVTGVGAATVNSVGASAGISTVTGVASSLTNSVGTAAGASTVTGVGSFIDSGSGSVGTSAGIATVTGVGASEVNAIGVSAGVSTVIGIGTSVAASVGTSAGTSAVTGVGAVTLPVGTAAGTSTVNGVGASEASAIGTITGTSTMTGVGVADGYVAPVSPGLGGSGGGVSQRRTLSTKKLNDFINSIGELVTAKPAIKLTETLLKLEPSAESLLTVSEALSEKLPTDAIAASLKLIEANLPEIEVLLEARKFEKQVALLTAQFKEDADELEEAALMFILLG